MRMKTGVHRKYTKLEKIISGGQTGVDRGALDAALDAGFPCAGSCPRGRRAEDGAIPDRYPLTELETANYRARTKRNVMDADGTLIVFFGELTGGTRETLRIAEDAGMPVLTIDARVKAAEAAAVEAAAFVEHHAIAVLNVAGPRESSRRGAADYARDLISAMLLRLRSAPHS